MAYKLNIIILLLISNYCCIGGCEAPPAKPAEQLLPPLLLQLVSLCWGQSLKSPRLQVLLGIAAHSRLILVLVQSWTRHRPHSVSITKLVRWAPPVPLGHLRCPIAER